MSKASSWAAVLALLVAAWPGCSTEATQTDPPDALDVPVADGIDALSDGLATSDSGGDGDGPPAPMDMDGDGAKAAADVLAGDGEGVVPDIVDMEVEPVGDAIDAAQDDLADVGNVPDGADTTLGADVADVWDAAEATPPPYCGNGVLDDGEDCDTGEAISATEPDACRPGCLLPWCGDGVTDTGEECDDADGDETDGCLASCVIGPNLPKPGYGDVIVTELMIDPSPAPDPQGEWIELRNRTDKALSLEGCKIHDQGTDTVALSSDGAGPVLEAQGFLLLGFSDPSADVSYQTMLLDNLADEVVLTCPSGVVDGLQYGAAVFPVVPGQAMALDPALESAQQNDLPSSWCAVDTPTPGLPNEACPVVDVDVDHCALSSAAAFTVSPGDEVPIVVEFTEAGLTDNSPGIDVAPQVVVEAGLGPEGASAPGKGWDWLVATPVDGWSDDGGADAYEAIFSAPSEGTFYIAGRVSLDAGTTWTLCDLPPGSTDGYAPGDAITLTVLPDPCDGVLCDSPPDSSCLDTVTALVTTAPGTCDPSDGVVQCMYGTWLLDCGLQGMLCQGKGTCGGSVPAPDAAGTLLFTEMMLAPSLVAADVGEWVEIHNPTDDPLALMGCSLEDGGGGAIDLTQGLVVPAGGFRVFAPITAPASNGGVPADVAYGNALSLGDEEGSLVLTCGTVLIDRVDYMPGWPNQAGAAMSLSPWALDGVANDDPANWCLASVPYGSGDLGTPGLANGDCPGDVEPIDACTTVGPAWIQVPSGTQWTLEAHLVEAGVTDASSAVDPSPSLLLEVGWMNQALDPASDPWLWTPAGPIVGWDAIAQGVSADTDGYGGALEAPSPGDYLVAHRASADGGHTWTLCDRSGSADGFDLSDTVALEAVPSSCHPSPCTASPGKACDGDTVIDLIVPSTCEILDGGAPSCTWQPWPVESCANYGAKCANGQCVDFPDLPDPGEVVLTELHIAPSLDATAEWFELTNTAGKTLTLEGCTLASGPGESWVIESATPSSVLLDPGTFFVLVRNAAGAAAAAVEGDAVYGSTLALDNASDTLSLTCDGEVIDAVSWDASSGWTIPVGLPLALGGNQVGALANDEPQAWCPASEAALPDLPAGTPGSANPLCPPLDQVIDGCVLLEPAGVSTTAGEAVWVSGLVYDAGTTDVTSGTDVAPGLVAQVGYGPPGTVPSDAATSPWVWSPASPDLAWQDDSAPGEDRWMAEIVPTDVGVLPVAMRFGADGGSTWLLCDLDGSSSPGESGSLGSMVVSPAPCLPNPCTSTLGLCDGAILQVPIAPGLCVDDGSGVGTCTYEHAAFDCTLYGGCVDGGCLHPPKAPKAGQIVVTEIHRDSSLPAPDLGEWIELTNVSGKPWDLQGCVLADAGGQTMVIPGPAPQVLPSLERWVIGASDDPAANGGLSVDIVWSGYVLDNVFDEVILYCGSTLIDAVAYSLGWPGEEGVAMQLSEGMLSSAANEMPGAWCPALWPYGAGDDLGTPGEANDDCP